MALIHHATKSRAAKAGFEIYEREGNFALRQENGAVTCTTWETAKDAVDAGLANRERLSHGFWIEPTPVSVEGIETPRAKSGVMNKSFHDIYTANGGGNGDELDQYMRSTFATAPEGKQKKPGIDTRKLADWGTDLGLWNPNWEKLNAGMQRMNLANRIRAYIRRTGDDIGLVGGALSNFGISKKG